MTGEKRTNINTVIRSVSNTLIQKIVAITNSIQNLNSKRTIRNRSRGNTDLYSNQR